MPHKIDQRPSPEDVLDCQAAAFEWAESFDSKDWERLSRCIAPELYIDYTTVMGMKWESMPATEFVSMASSPRFLGNPLIRTQHFMGQTQWVQTSPDEITGHHQMRVAHQKYKASSNQDVEGKDAAALGDVLCKGHAHGKATIKYKKIDGEWKFAGLEPGIRWSEGEYGRIFEEE